MSMTTVSGWLARLLTLSLGLLVAASLPARAAEDRLLFWQTSLPNSTIYLLGSMHMAAADVYPLRDTIMQAFQGADKLAVELDIGGASQMLIQQRMLERGVYADGKTLKSELSAETWQALVARFEAVGLPPEYMMKMKPGLVVTSLSTLEMMRLGLDAELGIDRYFLRLARDKKPILELETVDRQLDAILDVPEPELMVRQTLDQLDELELLMDELVSSWKRGDAKALSKLIIEDELAKHPEYRELHERMFDRRNREMTDKVLAMQREGGTYFVVVGAGHLVGDEGIVALLRREGQQPRQI